LALLFDYDGTLVPIVEHPRLARLDRATRGLLIRLMSRPRVFLGIISGRSLDDLKKMVRLPRVYYAGTGGLEVELLGVRIAHPQNARVTKLVTTLAERLHPVLDAYPRAWLENKRLGLTIHYRAVAGERIPALRAQVDAVLDCAAGELRIADGPMAVEITPDIGWNKGTAIEMIVHPP
jgi:trehalose-phosphatase